MEMNCHKPVLGLRELYSFRVRIPDVVPASSRYGTVYVNTFITDMSS